MELSEFKRILRQVMVLPVLALLALAGILVWLINGAYTTVGLIETSDSRIRLATLIERQVIDEETGLRGYQTTGDPRFLDPYYKAAIAMARSVADLRALQTTRPLTHLNAFLAEHKEWHDSFAEPLIATIAAGGQTSDLDLNLTGKTSMDSMRGHLETIIAMADKTRADRLAQWNQQIRNAFIGLILLAVFFGLLIGLFTRNRLESVSAAFRRALDLQRRRSEELFESEQHLRTTLASIGDGVITCDAHGCVQTMNLVAQELTGWLEPEAHNHPLEKVFNIVNETSRLPVENPVAKVKRLNRVVGLANHTILIRRDGSEIAIDDSGAPIRNPSGELTGVVMVFRDITMERKTRAALVANEKLAVAGRLAATIAHEIHNPLDSVANLLYLLQHGTDPDEAKQFLNMAQTELARVTQISRAMLSLYRESRAPVAVHLKDMLEDLLLLMERRFIDLGVTVSSELPPDSTVEGFPAELRQVFTNLITNAAEASGRDGQVFVRVTARPNGPTSAEAPGLPRPDPGFLIEVADTGPGILPEVRDRLFQPFFTTKGDRGTGLGLWVCQGIIRKHSGSLHLRDHASDSASTAVPAGFHAGTIATVFLSTKPVMDPGGD